MQQSLPLAFCTYCIIVGTLNVQCVITTVDWWNLQGLYLNRNLCFHAIRLHIKLSELAHLQFACTVKCNAHSKLSATV